MRLIHDYFGVDFELVWDSSAETGSRVTRPGRLHAQGLTPRWSRQRERGRRVRAAAQRESLAGLADL